MMKVDSKCWMHKGHTVLYDSARRFPYKVYDEEGFAFPPAFSSLDDCRKFIDILKVGTE